MTANDEDDNDNVDDGDDEAVGGSKAADRRGAEASWTVLAASSPRGDELLRRPSTATSSLASAPLQPRYSYYSTNHDKFTHWSFICSLPS